MDFQIKCTCTKREGFTHAHALINKKKEWFGVTVYLEAMSVANIQAAFLLFGKNLQKVIEQEGEEGEEKVKGEEGKSQKGEMEEMKDGITAKVTILKWREMQQKSKE